MRLGENFSALAETLQLQGKSVTDSLFDLAARPAGDYTSGEIGRISSVAGTGFFDDDQILFHDAGKASQSKECGRGAVRRGGNSPLAASHRERIGE